MTPTEVLENHVDVVRSGQRKAFRVEDKVTQSVD